MNAKFDVTDIVIETPRLILKKWEYEYLSDFFEYASVEGVGEKAGWIHHADINKSKEILTHFIEEKKTFANIYKENMKVIGSLGIEFYGNEDTFSEFFPYKGREIGFVLSKDYWNKGLMSEALSFVIDYLFSHLDYDFLLCGCYDFNLASKRVQEKCGFIPYRKLVFSTHMDTKESGILHLLVNPSKKIKFNFSHKETLLINE
ncbi:MAG: GNAT family N-acetyltransferase [Bacilli bacterium]